MEQVTFSAGKPYTFNGNQITIQELTVSQVRQIMTDLENEPAGQLIDDLLDTKIPVAAISRSTGLSIEELEKHQPSVIDELAKEVEQANPFFVGMIQRRLKLYQEMRGMVHKQAEKSSSILTTTPAN
jgi:hypothetical protein